MQAFRIEVAREGRWWMVRIPQLDGVTQARHRSEVSTMAREYISLVTGLEPDSFRTLGR